MIRTAIRTLKSFLGTPAAKPAPRATLGLTQMEAREMPSVTSAVLGTSSVYGTKHVTLSSDANASNVRVSQAGRNVTITDSTNGFARTYTTSQVQAVVFFGGGKADTVKNFAQYVQLRAYGYGGNDYLEGYDAADVLDGGDGDDTLAGFGGNDKLLGGAGRDTLKGGAGDDYLHGGAGADTFGGGSGADTFRRSLFSPGFQLSGTTGDQEGERSDEPVDVTGAFLNDARTAATRDSQWDVRQRATPTCSFTAALAAFAERTGVSDDLVQAVRYNAATDEYGVRLYVNGRWNTYWVTGDWTEGRDPTGRLWVTLYQKAYLQAMGVTSRDADGRLLAADRWAVPAGSDYRNPGTALEALTPGYSRWTGIGAAAAATMRSQVYNAGTYGMVATTRASGTGNGVVANHAYMVYDVYTVNGAWTVKLYNPWGRDNQRADGTFYAVSGADDGLITLTWAQFTANFTGYYRNS